MTVFTKTAVDIFAAQDASGAARKVSNHDVQVWGTEVERAVDGASIGRIDQATWVDLAEITGERDGQPAQVLGPDSGTHTDPATNETVPNEGTYIWSDSASGWRRVGGLPNYIVRATNTGEGTADAVKAETVPAGFNSEPYQALISINFVASNTGAMTLSLNGETPRALVTNIGEPIPAGYAKQKMAALVQIDEDGNYRLFSYGDATAIQAAVEALKLEVEQARDVVLQGLATVLAPKATVALAEADDPDTDPDFYATTYFDTSYKPRSGMLWLKQPSEPTIGAKFQNANGTWYLPGGTAIYPESLGPIGTVEDDTAAFLKAVEVAKHVDGAYVMLAPHPYQIDANVVMDGADEVFICGENPHLSVLELVKSRTGYLLSWYDATQDVHGGGLLGLTLKGHADIESGGNAGVRFGYDDINNGLYHHANGWITRDLFIKSFGQYGCAVNSGSGWDLWVDVSDHGFTAQDPGSCMGVYVYPKDETKKSRGGTIRSVYSRISDASMENLTNSAAMKIQTHVDLHAEYIYLEGGSEEVVSIDSPDGLRLDHLDVLLTQKTGLLAGRAGMVFRSRSPGHGFVASRCDIGVVNIRKVPGGTATVAVRLGAGRQDDTEHSQEGYRFRKIHAPGLQFSDLNYSSMKDCAFGEIICSSFRIGTDNARPDTLRNEGNRIGKLVMDTGNSSYDGDNTIFEQIIHALPNGSLLGRFDLYGDDNRVYDFISRNTVAGALRIHGKNNKIFDPKLEPGSGRAIIFESTSEANKIYRPIGHRLGTGIQYVADASAGNEVIQPEHYHEQVNNPANSTLIWAVNGNIYERAGNMTANRTDTISAVGMPDGATWDFIRTGGDTGGPWTWTLQDEDENVLATLSSGEGCRISKVGGALVRIASWTI